MKLTWCIAIGLLAAGVVCAQDDMPRKSGTDAPDFEPKLMLDGPHAAAVAEETPAGSEERVKELEDALTRAEGRAADAEQLYKEGILAKVEAEERATRVVKARKDLADENAALAAEKAEAVKKSFDAHEAAKGDLDAANATLKAAQDADGAAAAEWNKAEVDAATLDLKRKQKLYTEGVGTRREVEIAEDHLALVSGTAAK
jgi:hypothetical protein